MIYMGRRQEVAGGAGRAARAAEGDDLVGAPEAGTLCAEGA